jgi:hypothetical protein
LERTSNKTIGDLARAANRMVWYDAALIQDELKKEGQDFSHGLRRRDWI